MPTLNWIGKEAVVNHHQQAPFRLLKVMPELAASEPGSGNLIVRGDKPYSLSAALPFGHQHGCATFYVNLFDQANKLRKDIGTEPINRGILRGDCHE
jgi:hypothetical protein